jgi:hypothetical protein
MIREDKFLISRKPFAVNLDSFRRREREPGNSWAWFTVDAIWFRGTKDQPVACIGDLHTLIDDPEPTTAQEFLERFTDGRYGGNCEGRWNGTGYWGAEDLDIQRQHLAVLKPMLANYPARPDGWDGWWTFQTPKGRRP